MASSRLLFLLFILFIFFDKSTSVVITCPIKCRGSGPAVRFPFRLTVQSDDCGYPGFELSCNRGQTTLQLPNSAGEFVVESIDYLSQTIIINDPDHCLPQRFLNQSFSLSGSPFEGQYPFELTLLNCSSNQLPTVPGLRYMDCLRGANFWVAAIPTSQYNKSLALLISSCSEISKAWIPFLWPIWSNLAEGVILKWNVPDCTSCEEQGEFCGFKKVKNFNKEIGCTNIRGSPVIGLPRSAKYGIIIGVGIPGLLCFIGLGCYLGGKVRNYRQPRHSNTDFTTSITLQPPLVLNGLDAPTIESYPKILVGESGRLPKPNDNTCPICLCEYQAKETLRTIPECNHYFHANCIDEWLKINATCPLCRKSQESSTLVSPSSSTSSSSSSFMSAP